LMGLYLAYPVYWLTRLLFAATLRSPKEAT
jgi:hypothetical protein